MKITQMISNIVARIRKSTRFEIKNPTLTKIKKSTLLLIKDSTIQGLSNIFKDGKRITFRFMWIILLIFSSFACIFFTRKCLLDYFEHEIITTIKSIEDESSPFPAVSICSYNNPNLKIKVLRTFFNQNRMKTWQKHFENFTDPYYGACIRFNSGRNFTTNIDLKYSTSSGYEYGFWFDFYVNDSNDYTQLVIYIHNQTFKPTSLFNQGFFISSGNYNYFIVKRIYEQKLPAPFNQCFKDVRSFPFNKTLIDFILKSQKVYAQKDCVDLCRNLKYIEANSCDCSISSLDEVLVSKCGIFDQVETSKTCEAEFIRKFQENKPIETCSQYCPLECDVFKYEVSHFFEPILTHGNISVGFEFPEFRTYENVSKHFVSIAVYFEDLKYTLIDQKPKIEMFDLISNMGGIFGLFLGMGLLSFIELFEIFLEAFFILLKK